MKIVRMYSGDDGYSHFEDAEIDVTAELASGRYSDKLPTEWVMFREVIDGAGIPDFHPAPNRQLVINLTGAYDMDLGNGTVRRMGPGSVLLAEDFTGYGHRAIPVEGEQRTCIVVPLDNNVKFCK